MHTPLQFVIRPLAATEWMLYRDLRLQSLAESPDAFGSTLEAEAARPDALWIERLTNASTSGADLPLVAFVGGAPVALLWAKIAPSNNRVANLYQMWVAPSHRRLGIAREMLSITAEWAQSKSARAIELGATCGDTPAQRLYASFGFRPFGKAIPLREGSSLMAQEMRLNLASSGGT